MNGNAARRCALIFPAAGVTLKAALQCNKQDPLQAQAAGPRTFMARRPVLRRNVVLATLLALAALGMYVGIFLKVSGG